MSHTGKIIKSFTHCEYWCLDQKQPILIRNNNNLIRHSWKVISKTPFGELRKLMDDNKIFEYHS